MKAKRWKDAKAIYDKQFLEREKTNAFSKRLRHLRAKALKENNLTSYIQTQPEWLETPSPQNCAGHFAKIIDALDAARVFPADAIEQVLQKIVADMDMATFTIADFNAKFSKQLQTIKAEQQARTAVTEQDDDKTRKEIQKIFHNLEIQRRISHDAIASLFAYTHQRKYKYNHTLRQWFWNDGTNIWQPDLGVLIHDDLTETIHRIDYHYSTAMQKADTPEEAAFAVSVVQNILNKYHNHDHSSKVLKRAQSNITMHNIQQVNRGKSSMSTIARDWDSHDAFLPFPGGFYIDFDEPNKGEQKLKPGHLISKCMGFPLDLDLEYRNYTTVQMLLEILGTGLEGASYDEQMAMYNVVELALGFAPTLREEHTCMFCPSHGSNGKSSVLGSIAACGGSLHASIDSDAIFQYKYSGAQTASPELAKLNKIRVTTAMASQKGIAINIPAVLKSLDKHPFSVRALYGQPFTITPLFNLIIMQNFLPTIYDASGGLLRRVRTILFEREYPQDRRLEQLFADPKERQAQMMLFVHALLARANGSPHVMPRLIKERINDILGYDDSISRFLYERADTGPEYMNVHLPVNDLYATFTDWHKKSAGEKSKPMSASNFFKELALHHKVRFSNTIRNGVPVRVSSGLSFRVGHEAQFEGGMTPPTEAGAPSRPTLEVRTPPTPADDNDKVLADDNNQPPPTDDKNAIPLEEYDIDTMASEFNDEEDHD